MNNPITPIQWIDKVGVPQMDDADIRTGFSTTEILAGFLVINKNETLTLAESGKPASGVVTKSEKMADNSYRVSYAIASAGMTVRVKDTDTINAGDLLYVGANGLATTTATGNILLGSVISAENIPNYDAKCALIQFSFGG